METNFQLLMLSPNFLKSQIPISVGGGVGGNQFSTFDAESKFAKKNFFVKSFRAKKCLGMVLDFEYQVVRVYFVYANHKKGVTRNIEHLGLVTVGYRRYNCNTILLKYKYLRNYQKRSQLSELTSE